MLSFWERQSFLHYDYIIIGSGIVGLSTACAIKEKRPKSSVLILERGLFPSGASTKNAGFACFGSITELLEDWESMGKDEALRLVALRYEGLQLLRERIGDAQLDYQHHGGYELIRKSESYALDKIEEVNEWLWPYFESKVFSNVSHQLKDFGFGDSIRAMIRNQYEGQIDSGKMMKSLLLYAQSLGVEIFTSTEVHKFETETNGVGVLVNNPINKENIRLHANRLAVCNNAFAHQYLPQEDIKPGRGLVMISKPLVCLPFNGVFHLDKGYFYFRDFHNRLLIGGGRNLAFEAEETHEFGINPRIHQHLLDMIKEDILPNADFEIDTSWSGIMAFGKDKRPIVKMINDRIVVGVRLGGMGIAIGSKLGEELAQMIVESDG